MTTFGCVSAMNFCPFCRANPTQQCQSFKVEEHFLHYSALYKFHNMAQNTAGPHRLQQNLTKLSASCQYDPVPPGSYLDLGNDFLRHDGLQKLHCFCVLACGAIHEALQPGCIGFHGCVQLDSGIQLFSSDGLPASVNAGVLTRHKLVNAALTTEAAHWL